LLVRLATVHHAGSTTAARIEGDSAVLLDPPDVGAYLRLAEAGGEPRELATVPSATLHYAPLVAAPSKIVCVGMNYKAHIEEMGEQEPAYPTLFAKFTDALAGAADPIVLPRSSLQVDWEVELVAVVGRTTRRADADAAAAAIAGFTVGNDVSMRDFQGRTSQWLQGKSFDSATPVGPVMVTTDEVGVFPDLEIRCEVDGVVKQRSRTSDLLYGPADLVSYISGITTLRPGDLVFTGTPGGTGNGRQPQEWLRAGQSVASVIEEIGALLNPCVPE
jgi:acylpyruvate hydrolase